MKIQIYVTKKQKNAMKLVKNFLENKKTDLLESFKGMTFTQKHRHIFVSLSTQKILIMLINLKVFLRSCRVETENLRGLVKNRLN